MSLGADMAAANLDPNPNQVSNETSSLPTDCLSEACISDLESQVNPVIYLGYQALVYLSNYAYEVLFEGYYNRANGQLRLVGLSQRLGDMRWEEDANAGGLSTRVIRVREGEEFLSDEDGSGGGGLGRAPARNWLFDTTYDNLSFGPGAQGGRLGGTIDPKLLKPNYFQNLNGQVRSQLARDA
jgi:hypothetical protein